MFFIYLEKGTIAEIAFAISLLFFTASLFMSLIEIQLSTKSLDLELSDMELKDRSLVDYFKDKFDQGKP